LAEKEKQKNEILNDVFKKVTDFVTERVYTGLTNNEQGPACKAAPKEKQKKLKFERCF